MKHDVMLDAITQLDDALIEDAEKETRKRPRLRPVQGALAAAACLMLALIPVFSLPGSAEISLGGYTVSDSPVPIDGGIAAYAIRDVHPAGEVEVTFSVDAEKKTRLTVSDGVLFTAEAEGAALTLSSPADVTWRIESADPDICYRLTAGKDVYLLKYDNTLAGWFFQKEAAPHS